MYLLTARFFPLVGSTGWPLSSFCVHVDVLSTNPIERQTRTTSQAADQYYIGQPYPRMIINAKKVFKQFVR